MEFPCRDCLVKACCSEYCDKLTTTPRIIDMYLASLKQCPDCGNINNLSCERKSDIKYCYECSKVFQKRTVLKPNSPAEVLVTNQFPAPKKIFHIRVPTIVATSNTQFRTTASHGKIIEDTNPDPSMSSPYTMQETHDVLYTRMPKGEADYILKHLCRSYAAEIQFPPKKPKPLIKHPSWINKYPIVGPDDEPEPEEDYPWIVLK